MRKHGHTHVRARTHKTTVRSKRGFSHLVFHFLLKTSALRMLHKLTDHIGDHNWRRTPPPPPPTTTLPHHTHSSLPLKINKEVIYLSIYLNLDGTLNRLNRVSLVRASPSRRTCWNCHISHLLTLALTH